MTGRTVIVTGANSGIGRAAAGALAAAGARVVLAVRDTDKGQAAAAAMSGEVEVRRLDLANLASVREFAAGWEGDLDLLINNAGVMAPPHTLTKDGFESQFGTNHLGHFALTGLLLGKLLAAPAPRVVTLSSTGHRIGKIRFDDPQWTHGYNNWLAYGQSKLANLMFCFELDRRATLARTSLKSMAAHPGYAATNLQFAGPARSYERWLGEIGNKLFAQSADMGALPTLYAATVEDLPGGSFVGPDAFMEQRGYPHVVTAAGKAYNRADWGRLWALSEELTGVTFEFPA
jgi:NAD(P)-dependent dehydrogenase (short-subunit alcohol dehydrogenase family)